ncbi:MAG: 2-hydroxyacyl-CoA dehydratase [Promethearchaeota archaeon]
MPISMREDFLDYPSLLRLALSFLHGRDKLKRAKLRQHKKLVSMTFPLSDLPFAAGAVPVFPIRMHEFPESSIYRLVDLATSASGWGLFSRVLRAAQVVAPAKKFIDDVIVGVIENLNAKYNELANLAETNGVASDFCYGIKGMSGMFQTKGQNLDMNLNYIIRCSSFSKYYESLKKYVPNNAWLEFPVFSRAERSDPKFEAELVEFTKSEVERVVGQLEELTGESVTQHKLAEVARKTNECREIIEYFFFEAGKGPNLPCRPHAFSEILILLIYSFIDCCSDLDSYLESLRALKSETEKRLRSSRAFDASSLKKVFYVPVFGGYEPEIPSMVYENGGVCYFADWYSWNFLNRVRTTGDMYENYARHYLDLHQSIGCDWTEMVASYRKTVEKLKPDGVLFNQVFGCRMMSVGYSEFREAMLEAEVPVTLVNFNKIGENLGQTRTRVESFMEML